MWENQGAGHNGAQLQKDLSIKNEELTLNILNTATANSKLKKYPNFL